MANDLTTQDEERPRSPAEQAKARMEALVGAVEDRSEQLRVLLAESGIPWPRFVEVFRRAIIKGQGNDATNLLKADAGSVIQACMDACTAGLLPDGKQGAIVLYSTNVAPKGQPKRYVKKAQFLSMYEGLLKVAYESKNFRSIMAHVVYEGDVWEYELGVHPKITHKPARRPAVAEGAAAPPIIAAYAVAITTNGGEFIEVFEPEDIRKVMAVSRAASGPAKDWPEQMARKGPLRRLWKFLPKSPAMERAVEAEEGAYDFDALGSEAPEPTAEKKLSPGFRPKPEPHQHALPQGADQVVEMEMPLAEPEQVAVPAKAAAVEALRQQMPEPEPEPEDEALALNAVFKVSLEVAGSWLNIKQALRNVAKIEGEDMAVNRRAAWDRLEEMRQGGYSEAPDFVEDPVLFLCWLDGVEPAADHIDRNLTLLERRPEFQKLSDEDKAAFAALVEVARARSET